jgi:hypothetical protein
MTEADIKTLIQQQLPQIIAEDSQIRDFILRTVSNYYAPKDQTQDRFNQILEELRGDREQQQIKWEEQNRKWNEQNQKLEEQNQKWDQQNRKLEEQNRKLEEQNRKLEEQNRRWDQQNRRWNEQSLRWEEQNRRWNEQSLRWEEQNRRWNEQSLRWEEQNRRWNEQSLRWEESDRKFDQIMARMDCDREESNRKFEETLEEIKVLNRKYDSTIGALGSRWGLYSEASFRNALKGILEDSFDIEVININEYDDSGEVFGRPDQIELDLIIKNGLLIICEIKSSISKSEMYSFYRKVLFYEKRHQREANRKLVISPMVDERSKPIAEDLGIEIYSYADTVEFD